jgi:hypothetical protein
MRIRCNAEDNINIYCGIYISVAAVCETRASGKWYQVKWCEAHQGQVELVLPDGTRCDYVTDTHAIEFDFGNGWAEAINMRIR